ncbi:MAG: arginine--tRNA ligase [Candidatus Omnitrophota bacterium]
MKKSIQDSIILLIKEEVEGLLKGRKQPKEINLDIPADNRFGDLSTNVAMQLSKELKAPPQEIASILAGNLRGRIAKGPLENHIREVRTAGAGFINFYLSCDYFYSQLEALVREKDEALRLSLGEDKKVLVEFVSANPTGPLSVAHARQAAVGDALANILDFTGFKVGREYYLNDEGNQINILGRSIELRLKEMAGETVVFPDDHYQGEYIYDISRGIKDNNRQVKDFSVYGVEYILKVIRKELSDFGVEFDCWYSQKSLRESGKIDEALDFLKKKGFLYEEGGALWFKSTDFGDDKDRVVIKSDGSYTYLAPDIAYHRDKYRRGFKKLINLWGPDHHGYINRLKAAVAALGEDPLSLSVVIVQLATIFRQGEPVQMSTRRGQYITLREVLDEVGCDAARFFFLMRRTASHLDFDLDIARKQTAENPVYYVQYAHARIVSILRQGLAQEKTGGLDFSLLKEEEEIALLRKMWQFSDILSICVKTEDPYMITVYLQELAQSFHKFYDRHRVLGQEKGLTSARIALIEGVKIIIACGLRLLGVGAPSEM